MLVKVIFYCAYENEMFLNQSRSTLGRWSSKVLLSYGMTVISVLEQYERAGHHSLSKCSLGHRIADWSRFPEIRIGRRAVGSARVGQAIAKML